MTTCIQYCTTSVSSPIDLRLRVERGEVDPDPVDPGVPVPEAVVRHQLQAGGHGGQRQHGRPQEGLALAGRRHLVQQKTLVSAVPELDRVARAAAEEEEKAALAGGAMHMCGNARPGRQAG